MRSLITLLLVLALTPLFAIAQDTGKLQQVLINLTIAEVSIDKARKTSDDSTDVAELLETVVPSAEYGKLLDFGLVEDRQKIDRTLEKLRKAGSAKILAEPKLVTMSGRPAQFDVTEVVPVRTERPGANPTIEDQKVGTQLHVLPTILENGKIRLELRPRISWVDRSKKEKIDGRAVYSRLNVFEIDTAAELQSGHTVVLVHQDSNNPAGQTAIIVLATAELVEPSVADKNAPPSIDRPSTRR